MSLCNLPTEMLLKIFKYLNLYSLTQLACVCRRINVIISEILEKKSNGLLITNQVSEKFCERCKPLLPSYSSKFITYYNWKKKKYKENKIFEGTADNSEGYFTIGLEIIQNRLLFFRSSVLRAYNRTENGTVNKHEKDMTIQRCNSIIRDIACCNDVIISAHLDGSIRHWRIESRDDKNDFQLLKVHSNAHDSAICTISATSQLIASGSIKGDIKIQKNTYDEGVSTERNRIFHGHNREVEAIKFDPTGEKLAASVRLPHNPYDCMLSSFIIYDINKSQWSKKYAEESTCNKLLWEDPNTFLACYYNYIKKMDIRTPELVVRTWNAGRTKNYEYGTEIYLRDISSDNRYTIMTGSWCDKAVLWDQRKRKKPVKVYDMSKFEDFQRHDMVRSVVFDSCHLYIASYWDLYELDFKGGLDL